MSEHPEQDAVATALDGTRIDVTVDLVGEFVTLGTERGAFDLSPNEARALGEQLKVAAAAMDGQSDGLETGPQP